MTYGKWHHYRTCWAGALLLCLKASLAISSESGSPNDVACSLYRQGKPASVPIGIFQVPEIHGGAMEPHDLLVRPEYLSQPWSALSVAGELDHTALFEVEIESGQPPTDAKKHLPFEQTHFMLLLTGRAYGSPAFALGPLAGAPTGAPLTFPDFKVVGPGPASFSEITVEGQAEHVTEQSQLFAELDSKGKVTALLECHRPGAVPNPMCQLVDHIGVFDSKATFRRVELHRLSMVRERISGFVNCLTEE